MPAWIFHTLGRSRRLVALWFALAFLGGLPGGVVEWITLAMFGAFAYAVGFMIPLVVTYLVENRNRPDGLLVAGGGAVSARCRFRSRSDPGVGASTALDLRVMGDDIGGTMSRTPDKSPSCPTRNGDRRRPALPPPRNARLPADAPVAAAQDARRCPCRGGARTASAGRGARARSRQAGALAVRRPGTGRLPAAGGPDCGDRRSRGARPRCAGQGCRGISPMRIWSWR
jgi:hypothetical protein